MAGLVSAQSFSHFNPPPCDFSDQFYGDNGIVSCTPQSDGSCPRIAGAELNTEPDGRFGDFRQTGPPATGSQQNWVNDTSCAPNDPTRRNVRILATTGGNADDGNSPFSCFDGGTNGGFGPFATPQCVSQLSNVPETLEFISIIAFAHTQAFFENTYSRTVGAINGGLAGQQQNAGSTIEVGTFEGASSPAANPRNIRQEDIVGHFEAYGSISQFKQSTTNGVPTPTQFAANPCSLAMIQNQQNPNATSVPQPCFLVADTSSGGHTLSDVATPNLRQNWRFATNRNAMDGSDGNCVSLHDQNCKKAAFNDSPFGYFCDDLLGMWIITYFWFTQPPNTTVLPCHDVFAAIGAKNGFNLDGTPVILTAHELNDELEANNCGAEAQEDPGGSDGGAAWLVCPAIPDPRNGGITSDAFLDVTTHNSLLDPFVSNNFTCLQQTGKFCYESAPGQ